MIPPSPARDARRSRHRLALCAAAALVVLASHVATAAPPITVQGWTDKLRGQRARIHSLSVEFETKWDFSPALIESRIVSGGDPEVRQKASFAFSGQKQFCELESERYRSRGGRRTNYRTTIYDGRESRKRENKTLTIQTPKSAYASLNAYTSLLKWPITDNEILESHELKEGNPFLPGLLEHGQWVVLPGTERVGAADCAIIADRAGIYKIWVDPRLDYAMVRFLQRNPEPNCASWENTYSDFVKLPGPVYLPQTIDIVETFLDTKSRQPAGTAKGHLTAKQIHINDVPDSLFKLEPLPGETVADMINGRVYTYTVGTDQTLDENIERARPIQDYLEGARRRRIILGVQAVLGLALIAGLISWKLRRRTRGEATAP